MIRTRHIRRCGLAALAVAAAALPSAATAATGTTRLAFDGPAAQALRNQGIGFGPLKPATGGDRGVALPVAAGLAGSSTTLLRQRGGILLSGKGGSARLTKLSLLLGKRSLLEAKLGGEEIEMFKVMPGGRRNVDAAAGSVRLSDLRLKLTAAGARALASKLGLKSIPTRRFATLATDIAGLTRGDGDSTGGPKPAPDGPAIVGPTCPLPSSAGPAAQSAPPVAIRPPSAIDVTSASIAWHVRESFIRYIATGEGTSTSGGATAEPPVLLSGASAPLSYDFHFPFAAGWLDPGADPASPADDTAALYFNGALRFQYSGHGIDLVTGSPEIELAGGNSRAIFAVSDNGKAAERQVLVNLDLGRAGAISRNGNSYTYDRVPAAIPSGTASSVFAGFYAPGTDFGCFSVSFATR